MVLFGSSLRTCHRQPNSVFVAMNKSEMSPDAKRRKIKLALQKKKYEEALQAPTPHSEKKRSGPEWFAQIAIPDYLDDASEGFDSDTFISHLESNRARWARMLDDGKITAVRAEEAELLNELEMLKAEHHENGGEARRLIEEHDQAPEGLKSILLDIVNSAHGVSWLPDTPYEKEIVRISTRQSDIMGLKKELESRLRILRNVIGRYLHFGDIDPWDEVYAQFEVSEKELQQAYAKAGVAESEPQTEEVEIAALQYEDMRSIYEQQIWFVYQVFSYTTSKVRNARNLGPFLRSAIEAANKKDPMVHTIVSDESWRRDIRRKLIGAGHTLKGKLTVPVFSSLVKREMERITDEIRNGNRNGILRNREDESE